MNEFDQLSSSARNNVKFKNGRIEVCHYDSKTGTSHPITINENAWSAHQKHGDIPGNCSIETVTICNQTWMLKNLDVDHYRNGDPIPQVTDPAEWKSLTEGAWCYFKNDPGYGQVYGKLYNRFAVNDPRGLAPAGWHVPSLAEWDILIEDCLGGHNVAGGKMKETGTMHWMDPNIGATNESRFAALPGNMRGANGEFFTSTSINEGNWWTTTPWYSVCECQSPPGIFVSKVIANNQGFVINVVYGDAVGLSVRCIQDVPPSE